ncbi:MAG: MFS transporter, partial [Thermomicrobiaceae bacterium]|nr:MFS transporter [Thermomicrobiaceae bacterium]
MSEGQRGLFQTVYLPTALLAFGQGVMVPVLPLYAKEFGGSYSLAGSVVAAAWLGTMLADLPTGMLLPRVGLRRAMVAGAGLFALATVGLGLVHAVLALLALRVVAGVGTAFWGLSRHAYIAQAVPPAARGRAISVFGGINRVGAFAGPFVGGYIGQIYGLSAALIVAGVLAGLAVVVALLFVQDLPTEARPSEHRLDLGVLREAVGDNRRDVAAAGLAQIFGQMVRAGRQTVVPLYGRYAVGLDAAQVGQIVSASALVDMSLFIPAGWLMDRFGRKAAAVPSFAIMAVGMALVPLTASYWTLLGAVLVV